MYRAFKLIGRQRKSQSGVVMIAALMAVLILTAIGFFALGTSGDDIKIAARVIREEQALSAAESGVHVVCTTYLSVKNFNGQAALDGLPVTPIITGHTDDVSYQIDRFNKIGTIAATGSNLAGGSPWQYGLYTPVLTGTYKGNTIQIQAGILDAVPKAPN
jgi:hypothetical protein